MTAVVAGGAVAARLRDGVASSSPEGFRLAETFREARRCGRALFVPFVSGGDPDFASCLALLKALPAAGADMVELGIPFSDPSADGPDIQASSRRALAAGASVPRVLELASAFRRAHRCVPLVLMGYYNPLHAYGARRFAHDAAAAGVDGLIVVDLPPEEDAVLRLGCRECGVALVRLVAPTTGVERLPLIVGGASGFLYYVAVSGVTGGGGLREDSLRCGMARLRRATSLPVLAGFGVRSPAQAGLAARLADGVVAGSVLAAAIGREMERGGARAALRAACKVTRRLAAAVKEARGEAAGRVGRVVA